ncbi:hypothetical protein PENFLA_c013G02877 [Penicillium flavigenum]|uniref:Calcium uniporter protein, mitochondrial n=1 Tax=Penicillium flavigenum TaxID=254877 RepID=A0A1V6T856_9EURO|nr:hypothetical protein PENFLA_c013G02877 [Penicillium flavigenum]
MHFQARNCAPIVSAATGRISLSQRSAPYSSLGRIGSAGLNGWAENRSVGSSRHIRSFSGRHLGRGIGLGASGASPATKLYAGLTAVPRDHHAWIQARKISSADHTQVRGDKHKTEELLEKLEVQEGNQAARPQRAALGENGEGGKSPMEGEKLPERMTKGKMLTTPSRLFKLIIPLTTIINEDHDKDIEPIAILVHPQQPLSYLECLIQSELPPIKGNTGNLRPPAVSFIALQRDDNAIKPKKRIEDEIDLQGKQKQIKETDFVPGNDGVGGSKPLNGRSPIQHRRSREEDAETYSYPRKTNSGPPRDGEPERFVRWSQATEIGDFIRDAARAGEFIVSIEGAPSGLNQLRVTVPSFNERTYYLRMRLRKLSRRIQAMANVKEECDALAHRGAQRVAIGGFGILTIWWFTVYKLTFGTSLGWDTMEPVTYLVSLSTLMGGYLWFLYHNREISYKSALDFTISARQKKLYQLHQVDLQLWESLIDEGNSLRREIKNIAAEYDAEWNERADEHDKRVTEVLKSERGKHEKKRDSDDKKDEDDD